VASANCARYCGAAVDFVDIDPATLNMDPEVLAAKLEGQRRNGGALPSVVIPVHFAGVPCDMERISGLAGEYGFRIIEDASHALGSRYGEVAVGSCEHSDITVFSFHAIKMITTGEGGMALTRDSALADRMARLRSHGVTRDPGRLSDADQGPWYYEQEELGFNYRMTDIQAGLGCSQLERLGEFVRQRNVLARRYDHAFRDLRVLTQLIPATSVSAHHLYVLRILDGRRDDLYRALRADRVHVNVHYIPVHLQPYYRRQGFAPGHCPSAEAYYLETITLPLYPSLSEGAQDKVIQMVNQRLGA
jgi:dTDP-4-amino-4,6-dideoxygalactose transaminase